MPKAKGKSKSQPSDSWRWVTRQQAAELMGCTVENVDKLSANKKIEKDAAGKISIASAFAWVKGQSTEKKPAEGMEAEELKWKTLFRKVKARSSLMDLKFKRGEFISRDEVNQNYMLTLTAVRNSLMELVTRLPEKFSGMDVRDIASTLDSEIRKVLQDLSAQLKRAKNGNDESSLQAAVGIAAGAGREPEALESVSGDGSPARS